MSDVQIELRARAAKATQEATDLLKRASELIQSGQFTEAIEVQRQAVEKQNESQKLLYRAGGVSK